jgi:hypothetical protein
MATGSKTKSQESNVNVKKRFSDGRKLKIM